MDKLIKEFLSNKKSRNSQLLAVFIASAISIGQPWA